MGGTRFIGGLGGFLRKFIDSVAERRFDLDRFAEHDCQDLVASSDFGQVDVGHRGVGFQTDLLEIGHPIGRQRVVEVFGDGVGVQARPAVGNAGRRQPQTPQQVADAVDQVGGELALLDFLRKVLGIVRLQNAVEIGQQIAECESHGI